MFCAKVDYSGATVPIPHHAELSMSPAGDIGFPALPGGRSGRRRRGAARGRLSARETPLTSAACGICRCIVPWGYMQDLYRKVDDRRTGTALGDYAEPSGQRVSAFGLGGSIRWCENPMFRIAPLGSHRSTEWTLVSRSAGPYAGHGLTFSREGVTCGYRVRQVGLPPRVRSSAGSVEATRVGCGDPWCAAGGSGLALGGLPGRTDPDVEGSRLPGLAQRSIDDAGIVRGNREFAADRRAGCTPPVRAA